MSMCRVFSCVIGRGCLLWPVRSLGKTLLASGVWVYSYHHTTNLQNTYQLVKLKHYSLNNSFSLPPSPAHSPQPWQAPFCYIPSLCCSPGKNTGVGCHFLLLCMKVKSHSEVTQSCRTLSNPIDRSLPGSSVHGILPARVLEWGAIAFSVQPYEFEPTLGTSYK